MKVSIGFSKPKKCKPLASLIMLIEGTEYSHTFVTWHCTVINRRKVFEAVGSGLRILSNKVFKDHAQIVELYNFEIPEEQMIRVEQMAHDMAGTPYGTKALLGIGISMLFNWFNKTFKIKGKQSNIFKDGDKSNVCIEAAARILFDMLKEPLPSDIENFKLLDFNKEVEKKGEKVSQETINRINRR